MTSAQVFRVIPNGIATDVVHTALQPFSTGQAAFNWARRSGANWVTVIVKGRNRQYVAMTIVKIADHYEGKYAQHAFMEVHNA